MSDTKPKPPAEPFHPSLKKFLVPISSLKPDPNPTREHGEPSVEAILRSFQRFGQRKPLIADASGIVYAGNGRLLAAQRLGWTQILVVRFSGPPDRIRAFAIADNRTAELSTWHWDKLLDQLKELNTPSYGAAFFAWDQAIFADLPKISLEASGTKAHGGASTDEAIRQMLVKFSPNRYAKVVDLMERLCTKLKIENYSELVLKAARRWKKGK